MSDVANCPCCGATAKVICDEYGQIIRYHTLQDQDLIRKITQLKQAIAKQARSPDTATAKD
ncbi:hypothetical protein HZU77_000355 [Neisseriaceae bacterium TC5R-5]|nr:hypothetical protein [Neisseriaceae bacterium TC5R-5]